MAFAMPLFLATAVTQVPPRPPSDTFFPFEQDCSTMKFNLTYNEPVLIRKYPPESLSYETLLDLFAADMTEAFSLKFSYPLFLARGELA